MDDYKNNAQSCQKTHNMWKYLGCVLVTLTGSFLAFYFATSCTINHFIGHRYMMKQMRKMDRLNSDYKEDFKMFPNNDKMFQHKSAIEFVKTPEAYKFIIDLTPFQGNKDAIDVEVKDNKISISGESDYNGNNTETYTKMSQTYILGKGAKPDKISKKKVGNNYIITVPVED